MRSTPNHRAVKRVLMQNILLQNMFCIRDITLVEACFRLEACFECPRYFLGER
jgi:hypothetical protein